MNQIHPKAEVHPRAELDGVTVGPFAVIEDGVTIGEGSVVGSHAVIRRGSKLGRNNRVCEHALVGGDPQDLRFDPATDSGVSIGEGNVFREFSQVHRATAAGAFTRIGDRNFFMATSHVGHDVIVGNDVVVANGSLLAGFVQVGDRAFISGNCAIHQFVRIGTLCMLAGITKLPQDAPPYALIEGYPGRFRGLNVVGLRRAGLKPEARVALKRVYDVLYREHDSLSQAIAALEAMELDEHGRAVLDFAKSSKRGLLSPHWKREGASDAE